MAVNLSRAGLVQFVYEQPVDRLINDRETWDLTAIGDYAWANGQAPVDSNDYWISWLWTDILWPMNSTHSLLRWVLRGQPVTISSTGELVDPNWARKRRTYGNLQKQLKAEGFLVGWKG